MTSEYDFAGRRTKIALPGSTSLYANYDYDVLGNTTFVRENGANSGVGLLATYQYDSLSRRSSLTFGNGVVQGYTYDNASRLATQTNDLASTANDLTQTFSYNPASQITSVTRSNDAYAWTGHSNVNLGSTPNGLNQITNVGAATVTHDSKGNITAVGSDSYSYSSENFLTSGPNSTTLGYDPMGRLYQVANGAGTTRMGYDGLDRIAEFDGSNAILRRYLHGPGVDNPLVVYEGTGTASRNFLSSDERGSIITLTDSSGTLSTMNKYDEYGVPQSTNLGKFGYTGQAWVPEISLWYYKARFYWTGGRFMQSDPIGYEAGPNLYAYVENDPINVTDSMGLDPPNVDGGGCNPQTGQCGPVVVTATRCVSWACHTFGQGALFGIPSLGLGLSLFEGVGAIDETVDEKVVVTAKRKHNRQSVKQKVCDFLNGPHSDGTLQAGPSVSGGLLRRGGTGGAGVAIDRSGNIALYGYLGYGFASGTSGKVAGSFAVSNAHSVSDLGGAFLNGSANLAEGLAGSADVFVGESHHGNVAGGGLSVGGGFGASIFSGITNTWLTRSVNAYKALSLAIGC